MRRVSGLLSLILAGATAPLFASTTLDVYVRAPGGSAIAGSSVAAMSFGANGPDGSVFTMGVTSAGGLAHLTLTDNKPYEIVAAMQGYVPTIRDQFNDPAHPHVYPTGGLLPAATIYISSMDPRVGHLGEIDVEVQHASNNAWLFCDVRPNSAASDVSLAYGMTQTDGSGQATLAGNNVVRFWNVPFSSGSTYNVGCFDSVSSKGVSSLVPDNFWTSPLQYTIAGGQSFDFNAGMPPVQVQNQTQQGSGNGLSVDGVVVDTATAHNSISNIGINFNFVRSDPYCQNCFDNRWVNTDQNGRFQLYGLQPQTSYYVTLNAGCNWQTSTCYQGVQSTVTAYAQYSLTSATKSVLTPGVDFFYASTAAILALQLQMPQVTGGANSMAVYVQDQDGNPLPQSGVNLGPDGRNWETKGDGSCHPGTAWQASNPGLANINQQATTGYALLTGLPGGNYMLNIWTQFSQNQGTSFNAGTQSTNSYTSPQGDVWDWNHLCGSGNWRLSIATDTHRISIYDSFGNTLLSGQSSVTVHINVPTATTGLVKGTLTFPPNTTPNLTNDPINITIQPQCDSMGGCQGQGGYAAISKQLTQNTTTYQIHVSSGYSYYMNVTSSYWGQVRDGGGDNQVDLTSTGTVTVDMNFARSGRLVGKLYKPDGSVFTPTTSGQSQVQPNISANGDNSYGWSQVNPDGTYSIGGLLPGQYPLHIKAWVSGGGVFNYTDASPVPNATITAQLDTYKDISMVKGVPVRVIVDTSTLPNMTVSDCSSPVSGKSDCPPQNFVVKMVSAGTVFDVDMLSSFVLNGGSEDNTAFRFLPRTSPANANNLSGRICNDGNFVGPAFCVNRVPSPSNFDMYLMRKGGMDQYSGVRPYFTILNSTRNIVVDDSHTVPGYVWGSSTLTVRPVSLAPATNMHGLAGTTLTGKIAGNSIFLQSEFQALGGNFENFLKYIPLLALYDANNSLKAVGSVIPNPGCFLSTTVYNGQTMSIDAALKASIANGDWNEFQNLFFGASAPCGGANSWGFDIRGLTAYQSYTAVLTTPNYPPYQFPVTMDVTDGSTKTLTAIDLDSVVGVGGRIDGVVVSTPSFVRLPNATVTIAAPGLKQKTFNTVETGTFTAVGLPDGNYKISAVAQGYVMQAQSQAISKGNTVSVRLALPTADASISGTVYAQKMPYVKLQPDALILARLEESDTYQGDLAVYKTYTSSVGFYQLDGLQSGLTYRIYVKAPGMMIMSATTVTIVGVAGGMDFTPTPKPLDVEVYGLPSGTCISGTCTGTYDFTILNPTDFDGNSAKAYYGVAPYDFTVSHGTDVTNNFQNLPNNQVILQVPLGVLNQTKDYVLHLEAYSILDRSKLVTKEITFGVNRSAGAEISIDDAILGDDTKDDRGHSANDALLDFTGNNASAVTIPAGSLIPISSAAVPTLSFSAVAPANSTQAAVVGNDAAFASPVYQIQLASANYGTDRGVDITLAYDKSNSDPTDLAVYHQDPTTGQWDNLLGQGFTQTIDPVKRTITVKKLKSLASVLRVRSDLKARMTSQGLAPSAAMRPLGLRPDDIGVFGILKPSLVGNTYNSTALKIFNFPNPFSPSSPPTATLKFAPGMVTTKGTVIRLDLPANVTGGHGTIRIYNLAGQMVRELDLDNITGGKYYYTGWDGKNKNGADVANGVYYGILNLPGVKAKDGTFKMAVIK